MTMELDRVLQDFLLEAQENLERVDREFVKLEQDKDNKELLASIFRTIHTIKGSAGFLNLPCLEELSHTTEDVLSSVRDHSLALESDVVTSLLHAVDGIKSILVHLEQTGEEGEHNVTPLIEVLQQVKQGQPVPDLTDTRPGVSEASGDQDDAGKVPDAQIAPQAPPQQSDKASPQQPEEASSGPHALTSVEETRIHVDIALLDQLMNLTGELVLSRNRVVQIANAEEIEKRTLRLVAQRLNHVVSDIQDMVMKTRMQSIYKVFGLLPRLVRDASKAQNKDVLLLMEGQDTELDRSLLEAIKDPIIHVVRNAIDHGIESPEQRREQGKPPGGKLLVKAYHEGGQVHIDVIDDGAGIDAQQLKNKAVKEGILTPQQAEELNERDTLNLIFHSGFSTSKTVTSMSGRGVGMDVVRKNLDRIGGIVDVRSKVGEGTTVKFRIPITLAIIPVLIVETAGQRFAIPQANLEELVMVHDASESSDRIETVYGAEVYRLRGELLPLLRLSDVLEISAEDLPEEEPLPTQTENTFAQTLHGSAEEINIVVLAAGETRFGLIVDKVGATEEIVVKPLGRHVKQIPCYEGATIMGDGKVAMILNVLGLFTIAQINLDKIKKAEKAVQEQEDAQLTSSKDQHQTIVLFRTGHNEYYGVPLAFVVRLEEFHSSQIETSGGREVLQYRGGILPLIRLEPYLNMPPAPDPDVMSLIVFSIEKQIGLVVHEILNTVEISTHIDTETFQQQGVLGSTIVEGHSVLILDIHGLIEMAYPTWYKQFFVSHLSDDERENIRVLLVEDSPFFLNIERSYLESAGYRVLSAEHGNEAFEMLQEHTVDVIVTDIDMPYCNGYELTQKIRADDELKYLPIMAVTALSGEEDRLKGREVGIDEYRIKLDREEVLRALESLIVRSRKQQAARDA